MEEEQSLPWGMVVKRVGSEVYRVFRKRIAERLEIKLTVDEYGLLVAINRQGDEVIQKNMAEAMRKDQSVILKLIDSLEKGKLIRRIVHPRDRRKNFLKITKKGEEVMNQYLKIELELIEEVQQGLQKSDIECFSRILTFIQAKTEKM
jgi:DNA-binding MarR family transcriptional regulator